MGAERGVNCEHFQVLVTNLLQKHWEWQDRPEAVLHGARDKTMYLANLDVNIAFDVAVSPVGEPTQRRQVEQPAPPQQCALNKRRHGYESHRRRATDQTDSETPRDGRLGATVRTNMEL